MFRDCPPGNGRTPLAGVDLAALAFSVLTGVAGSTSAGCTSAKDSVSIFAAASTAAAVETFIAARQGSGPATTVNAAASSTLARQIDAGAPADVFLSADTGWVDWLDARGQVAARTDLLGNRLVLITPADSPPHPGFQRYEGRLALADPDHVPAGRYARAALERAGAWNALRDRVVPAANVRAALALVERGEADAAIVYETDARGRPGIRIERTFDADPERPIVYPLAVVRGREREAVTRVFESLRGPEAARHFRAHGFSWRVETD